MAKKSAAVHEGLSGLIIRVCGQSGSSEGKMMGQCGTSRSTQPADGTATECDITDRPSTYGRNSQAHSSECQETCPEPSKRQ